MSDVRQVALNIIGTLSDANRAKTEKLADARELDASVYLLGTETFDIKVPRYLMADLIIALRGAS